MIVENKELQVLFNNGEEKGNWDPFFKKTEDIVSYTISTKFPNLKFYCYDLEAIKQECLLQVWKLIEKKQLDKNRNIFSYIIGAVSFKLRDHIRKENRRGKLAKIINVDDSTLVFLKSQRF